MRAKGFVLFFACAGMCAIDWELGRESWAIWLGFLAVVNLMVTLKEVTE